MTRGKSDVKFKEDSTEMEIDFSRIENEDNCSKNDSP